MNYVKASGEACMSEGIYLYMYELWCDGFLAAEKIAVRKIKERIAK